MIKLPVGGFLLFNVIVADPFHAGLPVGFVSKEVLVRIFQVGLLEVLSAPVEAPHSPSKPTVSKFNKF